MKSFLSVATLLLATSVRTTSAFAPPPTLGRVSHSIRSPRSLAPLLNQQQDKNDQFAQQPKQQQESSFLPPVLKTVPLLTTALVWTATTAAANAAGPDWGLFEGRTGSLLHPVMMGGLLAYSLSTALLGFQWRRQRTLGDEISALKAQLPKPAEGEEAPAPSPKEVELNKEIKALQDERKELAAAGPRDRHFGQGAFLAFLGTAFAIEGPLNTYARAGKLFPGPHLYAGAGLVVLWALAVATVPSMQKGSDTARTIHISANVAGIGLFVWQVTSGIPILFKVLEFTKWP